MEFSLELIFSSICTVALGGFIVYTILKLKALEAEVYAFPSTEELAKQIVKIKLPIEDLPPDVAEKLRAINAGLMSPPGMNTPYGAPPPDLFDETKKSNYIG